MPKIESEALG